MSDYEDNWSQDNYGNQDDDFERGYMDDDSDVDMQEFIKREQQYGIPNSEEQLSQTSSEDSDQMNFDLSDVEEEEQVKKIQTALQQPMKKNDEKITVPYLSKYEKAAIIGKRAMQISKNSKEKKEFSPLDIAEKELREQKIPFIIRRPLPNGQYEEWKIEELIQ